jgi:hypothetical protein
MFVLFVWVVVDPSPKPLKRYRRRGIGHQIMLDVGQKTPDLDPQLYRVGQFLDPKTQALTSSLKCSLTKRKQKLVDDA